MTDILRFHWLFLLIAAPCVGSFLGVVAARLPAGRSPLPGRSACPHCGQVLGVRDLLPLLGWLLNRGRCRHCRQAVSWAYPAIELAALAVAVWSLAVLPGWLAWAGAGLGWILLTLAVIDARHLLLPDTLSLPLVPAGLLVAWVSWAGLPSVLLLAAAGGLAGHVVAARLTGTSLKDRELPFGPYVAGAFWLIWLYGPLSLG